GESTFDRNDAFRNVFAGEYILGRVHQLRAEQRIAFDDVVDLAFACRLHAVTHAVHGADLDVYAGPEAGRFRRLDGSERHVVVVGVQHVDVLMRLQERLHDFLAFSAGKVARLRSDDLELRIRLDHLLEAGHPVIRRRRAGRALQLYDVDV